MSSRERYENKEQPRPVFDLEQLTPDHVASLVAALGTVLDANSETQHRLGKIGGESPQHDELITLIGHDAKRLIEDDINRADELFIALIKYPNPWPREVALDHMASDLLRHHPDHTPTRQQLIDEWVTQFDVDDDDIENGGLVREAAVEAMSGAVHSDWLDEPTARYLDSLLPAEWQREEWWTT